MSEGGYIHVHRRLLGHPAFRNDGEAMGFAWMCLRASWQPVRVRYKGMAVRLERGQLAVSVRDLAEALDRPKGWVERLLARLKSETMIQTHSETGVTVITICNYDDFQPSQDAGRTPRETSGWTLAGQRRDTEQRREKGKEGKKEDTPSESSISDRPEPAASRRSMAMTVRSSVGSPAPDEVGEAFSAYQACRFELVLGARPLVLSQARRGALASRLREIGGIERWHEVLARIRGSPFLRGDTARSGFVAEIDWLLKPANLLKVMEGNYDERSPANVSGRPRIPASPIDALVEARSLLGIGR
ncbi:hypothetical protein [uncultured Sphingomonas sp.]|uniref:hypothetical protein n=1 Tax=uncultured Sphingomonas sp. TaxID=158754 RepID=UPI0025931C96|nr:hypothetical protein [uncultured Sphingomonas sp.]